MAFQAKLDVAGTEYVLNSCHYSLYQATDPSIGKPTSLVQPAPISCEVKVDKDNIKAFWTWAMKHNEKQNGSIKFFKIDEDASLYELKFEDAFCTSFSSGMTSAGSADMSISIEISARKIEIDGEGFDLIW